MRHITLLAAALSLSAGLALTAAPAAAREVLVTGQGWNMPQDFSRMDAPARAPSGVQPLSVSEQRARRAAIQRGKARVHSGLALRAPR